MLTSACLAIFVDGSGCDFCCGYADFGSLAKLDCTPSGLVTMTALPPSPSYGAQREEDCPEYWIRMVISRI
mgnify:CR=1 FL=1|jgi:hypothetical protein